MISLLINDFGNKYTTFAYQLGVQTHFSGKIMFESGQILLFMDRYEETD